MPGWIKLNRKILSWEWFTDANAFRVFTYLLLSANHKPSTWRGIAVLSGQHITSAEIIAQKLGLTRQMVQTSLNKLKSTGEITAEAIWQSLKNESSIILDFCITFSLRN